MKLGILLNSTNHLTLLDAITRAAIGKGHEVLIFVMGEGVPLLTNEGLVELGLLDGVKVSFCQFNASASGIENGSVMPGLNSGSQFDNALMVRDTDKVISL